MKFFNLVILHQKTKISAWETTVEMNGVNEYLRYLKFLKKVTNIKTNKSKYTQICIITTSHTIPLKTLFKIIKARWLIENVRQEVAA